MHAFILFVLWCGLLVTSIVGENNETDRLALLAFKAKITDDPLQVMSSWNDSIHFCQWRGVTCGRRHQRVIVLDQRTSKLVSSISPRVGNLSFLKNLILSNNIFHSEIPSKIDRLRRLQIRHLYNDTLSGKFSRNLSHCTNLKQIDFDWNLLDGEIPATLGTLSKLQLIITWVGVSLLLLAKLTKLTFFGVGVNRLSGRISPSIFNLSSLKDFYVGDNQIQGHLPSEIGITLPNIENFVIGTNQFTGPILISISNASNLKLLELTGNKLRGRVPSLEKLYRVSFFTVALNELGNRWANDLKLPKCIANSSTTLVFLSLGDNKISGNIPLGIGNLINLENLNMRNNKLSSNIPSKIGKLRKLQILDLSNNNFLGNIPSSLGNLTLLINFGTISYQVFSLLFSLIFLDLSTNKFTGVLPIEVGNFINLQELKITENMLFGEIPASIGSCVKLEILAMGSNFFQGVIPSSLESLRGLQVLDLSKNNFSGNIPKFLESFIFLQLLNLSYNDFDGEVPTNGVFKNTSATMIKGNGKLCGGMPKFHLPSPKSYRCISTTNLIGVGGFRSMYRGTLHQDSHKVAVKVLNLLHHGASKVLLHWNLVKVLIACSGVDYQGHDFKALVYEFMTNGNLDGWLYPYSRRNEVPKEKMILNLLQRLNIAIDVAHALEYLHHHCHTPIVRCDLKPSNVLLDDKMIGHVGDFGLASYDILLLEMFTRKRPTNNIFKDNLNLHDFIWKQGEMILIQNRIGSPKILECLMLILGIGVSCSMESPRERMNISDVVAQLHLIREKLLRRRTRRERLQLTSKLFMTLVAVQMANDPIGSGHNSLMRF
ncbi:hypothetical protein ACB098_11G153100 [Castanea mollissima]